MALGRRSTLLLSVAALALPAALGACMQDEDLKYSLKSPSGHPNEAVSESKEADSARLMRIARATHDSGDPASAASMYQRAASLAPNSVAPLLALAGAYRELGLPENAEATYRSALALEPGNIEAQRGLGAALIALNRPEDAGAVYEALISAEPLDPRAYNGKGTALAMQQRHEEAQEAFRTGLRLAPDNMQLNNNLALSLTMSGRPSEAVPILQRLAAMPDAPPRVRENLVLAQRAADSNPVDVAALDAPAGADSTGEVTAAPAASSSMAAKTPAEPSNSVAAAEPKVEKKAEKQAEKQAEPAAAAAPATTPATEKTSKSEPTSYESLSPSAGVADMPEVITGNSNDDSESERPTARMIDVDAEVALAQEDAAFDAVDGPGNDQGTSISDEEAVAALDDVTMTDGQERSATEAATPPGDDITARIVDATDSSAGHELAALGDESEGDPGEVVLSPPEQRYAVIDVPAKPTRATAPIQPSPAPSEPIPISPKGTELAAIEPAPSPSQNISAPAAEKAADQSAPIPILAQASATASAETPKSAGATVMAAAEPDQSNVAELASIEPAGLAPKEEAGAIRAEAKPVPAKQGASLETTRQPEATATGERKFRVQLSAESSEQNARDKWNELVALAPDLLGTLAPRINQRGDGANGTPNYRLRTDPPMSEASATALCNGLKAKGVACFLSKIWRETPAATASIDQGGFLVDPSTTAAAIAPASGGAADTGIGEGR